MSFCPKRLGPLDCIDVSDQLAPQTDDNVVRATPLVRFCLVNDLARLLDGLIMQMTVDKWAEVNQLLSLSASLFISYNTRFYNRNGQYAACVSPVSFSSLPGTARS